eukprot:328557_1
MSSTSTQPVSSLSQLAFCLEHYIPKPSYDPTNKNCIIISTHYKATKTPAGIYKYNIETNKPEIICKYNNTFKSQYHGQFINTSNNTLILYGGDYNIFKIFDLNTNQIKQIN